jgi:hypothetical protein
VGQPHLERQQKPAGRRRKIADLVAARAVENRDSSVERLGYEYQVLIACNPMRKVGALREDRRFGRCLCAKLARASPIVIARARDVVARGLMDMAGSLLPVA